MPQAPARGTPTVCYTRTWIGLSSRLSICHFQFSIFNSAGGTMERLRTFLRWRNINIALFLLILIAIGGVLGPLALSGPALVGITPADGATDANPQAGIQI